MSRTITPHRSWSPRLEQDLALLEARYTEHARHFPADWLDYGELDPTEPAPLLLFVDRETGQRPILEWPNPGCRAIVHGEVVGHGSRSYEAILEWNNSARAVHPPWPELPFFFLNGLSARDARYKLGKLRSHLEIRTRLYKMRRMSGINVGSRFISRLKAYRGWCELSQAILQGQLAQK